MTHILSLRLTTKEVTMLDRIKHSESRGDGNRSEVLRLLIHREFNRRFRGPKLQSSDYATDFRTKGHNPQ